MNVDMNVLGQILISAGINVASNITWSVLKTSGEAIITKFKDRFGNNKKFKTEEDCQKFLEKLANGTCDDVMGAFLYISSSYKEVTKNEDGNFAEEFLAWIKENESDFIKLGETTNQTSSIKIGKQTNSGSGTIVNTGIMNGNIGRMS